METNYAQEKAAAREQATPAGEFDIKQKSFLLPQPLPKGKYSQQAAILYVVPAIDWTYELIAAPMLSYAGKYSLPKGFNLQASLATLFVSTRANFGPFWNYSAGNYHFGLGYQVVFNLGVLHHFEFATVLTGWEQQPSVTIGYSFRKSAVILRGDLYWTNSFNLIEDKNVIRYNNSFINGYSFSGSLEQRLWKDHLLSFGVKMYYVKYHIIAWPAFPVNQYRYWVPEFQLGLDF